MRFTMMVSALALAMSVSAAPQWANDNGYTNNFTPVPSTTTIQEANSVCGSNTQLSCCNQANTSGSSQNQASGILSGLLGGLGGGNGGLGLFNGCSKLDVTAGIVGGGVSDLLNSQCKQTAACCQNVKDGGQSGLVALGIPCVALGGLL